MTDIVDRLRRWWEPYGGGMSGAEANADDLIQEAADEIERLRAERDRLRNALLIADTACRSYWGWEYGRPGDVDDDDVPDSSLLVKWRRDYEARAKLKENDQ